MMDARTIRNEAHELLGEITGFRRHIHRHPELSFTEQATAEYISRTLKAHAIECTPIAGTGVLARIEGGGDLRKAVVLRADIDALPVEEATGLEYASQNPGVMHACGHDLHTAALMGALMIINRHRDQLNGTLFGLFQPGEELLPGGASMVLIEDPFRDYEIRGFFGQHVEPELPTGFFGFREGEYMASTDELYFTVHGEGGHAAMPDRLRNPVPAAATLLLELQRIPDGAPSPAVITIGRVISDGATNVVPDRVEMAGTMRTFDEEWRAAAKERIRAAARAVGQAHQVGIEVDIRDGFPSVINDHSLARRAMELTAGLYDARNVAPLDRRMTGEDFGYYTRKYPSVFYRFGAGGKAVMDGRGNVIADRTPGGQPVFRLTGEAGKLHSPVFNPDDSALEYAAAGLANLALNI